MVICEGERVAVAVVAVGVTVLATTVMTAPLSGVPVTWMLLPEVNPCPVKAPELAKLAI